MRLFRWLLRLCPPALRVDYGDAMEETLAARLADARTRGWLRAAWVAIRELGGLVVVVCLEKRRGGRRAPPQSRRIDAAWKAGLMDGWWLDLRQAAKRLVAAPIFAVAAILTLSLAIGANVAIFAVVERVVLNPLPYPEAERLVAITHRVPRVSTPTFAAMPLGIYYQYAQRARSLTAIAAYQREDVTLTGSGTPERIRAVLATPSLVDVLGVAPVRGRWFFEAEGTPGAARVAVLSHGFWLRRFGGDPASVGRSLTVNGEPTHVVGIMPEAFRFPDERVDLWIADRQTQAAGFGLFTHQAVARMYPGVTLPDLGAELSRLIAELPEAYPGSALALSLAMEKMAAAPEDLKTSSVGSIERTLWTLLAAMALVLLVACANVANLFLVRSAARQREVAVRRALGAGGRGIARYFLTESALLAAAGGVLALFLAWGAIRLLVTTAPDTLPRLSEVGLGLWAILYAGALMLASAGAFGAIPLLHGGPLATALVDQGRSNTASLRRHRVRHVLMAGQVAAALVLLVAAGLMIRSFQQLTAIDLGFDPGSTLTFRIALEGSDYQDRSQSVAAHQAILDRLAAIPGVTAVSAATTLPLGGLGWGNSIFVERQAGEERPAARPVANFRAVAAGYFEALGMRLLRGRPLTRDDIERAEPHVVINQALASAYFPGQDPIGRRIASSRPPNLPPPAWLTIVGVVANTPTTSLAEPQPLPKVFMPLSIAGAPAIAPALLVGPNVSEMSYVVRTASSPSAVTPAARAAVDAVDRALALADVRTFDAIVDLSAAQAAFSMVLLTIAAGATMLLGGVGIYGVMAYVVSQRTAEIGVRLALGAQPRRVAGAIVRQGGLVAVAGLGVGVGVALAASRWIESLLYGVSPRDPAVFAVMTVLLLLIAVVASWVPARRAARLSPLAALRAE